MMYANDIIERHKATDIGFYKSEGVIAVAEEHPLMSVLFPLAACFSVVESVRQALLMAYGEQVLVNCSDSEITTFVARFHNIDLSASDVMRCQDLKIKINQGRPCYTAPIDVIEAICSDGKYSQWLNDNFIRKRGSFVTISEIDSWLRQTGYLLVDAPEFWKQKGLSITAFYEIERDYGFKSPFLRLILKKNS